MDINGIMICPSRKIFNLYCYRVAGAVGLISLKIFGCYDKKSKSFGLYLANALQITNILRDIKEDQSMGRMYFPRDILDKSGIKTNKIILILKNKNFPEACRNLSRFADLNFNNADRILKSCSKKKLKSAILMMDTYKMLLKKLKKENWQNIDKKINLTSVEKVFLFIKGII